MSLNEEKGLRDSALWGLFWALSLYLEIPEQIRQMQGAEENCKGVT